MKLLTLVKFVIGYAFGVAVPTQDAFWFWARLRKRQLVYAVMLFMLVGCTTGGGVVMPPAVMGDAATLPMPQTMPWPTLPKLGLPQLPSISIPVPPGTVPFPLFYVPEYAIPRVQADTMPLERADTDFADPNSQPPENCKPGPQTEIPDAAKRIIDAGGFALTEVWDKGDGFTLGFFTAAGESVGYIQIALEFFNGQGAWIEYLQVDQAFRSVGIGTYLLNVGNRKIGELFGEVGRSYPRIFTDIHGRRYSSYWCGKTPEKYYDEMGREMVGHKIEAPDNYPEAPPSPKWFQGPRIQMNPLTPWSTERIQAHLQELEQNATMAAATSN